MNEHELLDKIALVYINHKKKPKDAYDYALKAILNDALPAHRSLDTAIKRLKRRGDL